jgi:hypothetical protein
MIPNRYLALIGAALSLTPVSTWACSPPESVYDTLPKSAAARGFLVKARVVRGYDAQKRTPEKLEIEKTFVGPDIPRTITLYHDDRFYDERSKGVGDTCSVEFSESQTKALLLILYPAPRLPGINTPDLFVIDPFYSIATHGPGLDILLAEARRLGRLRGQPLPEDF